MEKRLYEAPCGILTLNHAGEIVEANATLCKWLKTSEEVLVNNHIEVLLNSANRMMYHSYFYPMIELNGEIESLFMQFTFNEQTIPFLLNAKATEIDGRCVIDCFMMPMQKRIDYELELKEAKQLSEAAYVAKEQALEELRHLHEEIEQKQLQLLESNAQLLALSNTDKLTGIANRRLFQEQLETYIERFERNGKTFSLLLLDIDYFKKVNDTYGHLAGDIVLKELATLLSELARSNDIVARYGGEEFVVLLPDVQVHESEEIAWELNKAVAQKLWPEVETLTISVGVSTFKEGYTAETVIEYADQALYKSKQQGRNRVTHFNKMMQVN